MHTKELKSVKTQRFYSHGNLLLTGEYLVLSGAKALALPCLLGQELNFTESENEKLYWISYDENQSVWFDAVFDINSLICLFTSSTPVAKQLKNILQSVRISNPDFLNKGGKVETYLEFNRHWGLGSSATLIANIGQWTKTDPYQLLQNTFGGSGYDVACAMSSKPIVYTLSNNKPHSTPIVFDPPFKEQLYFVYLNQKQNSQREVLTFLQKKVASSDIETCDQITEAILSCADQFEFNRLLNEHETLLSKILNRSSIQQTHFSDFPGQIKSLGAWGGDFAIASGEDNTPKYFSDKGHPICLSYSSLIKS